MSDCIKPRTKVSVFRSLEGIGGCWVHMPTSVFYPSGVPTIRDIDLAYCSNFTVYSDIYLKRDKLENLEYQLIPANNSLLNRDGGHELPGYWIATMKKLGRIDSICGGANRISASTFTTDPDRMRVQVQKPCL